MMMLFKLYKTVPITVRSGVKTPKKVNILEVGPRDGLQNESKILSINTRYEFIKRIHECSITDIEIGSMSNPKFVPQMKDSHVLVDLLNKDKKKEYAYSMLIPNSKGFDLLNKSTESKIDEVLFNVATSETFNKKNMGKSIDESLIDIKNMIDLSNKLSITIRLSISTVWGCPYENKQNSDNLMKILEFCNENNIRKIDLADTISSAKPDNVYDIFERALQFMPNSYFAAHMHNIDDIGLKNVEAALLAGVSSIHSSILGIGGCPFSTTRAGNIDTLELVQFLENKNIEHGVNIEKLIQTRDWLKLQLQN